MSNHYETKEESHPIATGTGALSGGVAAGALGTAIAGPVGGVIGLITGAFAGGAAGHEVAEQFDPTDEDSYWRDNFNSRPYAAHQSYDKYRPAYAYGWTTRRAYLDRDFDEVESDLESGWEQFEDKVELKWDQAKHAVRDGWDRVSNSFDRMFDDEDEYWQANYSTRPYVGEASTYEQYQPAYQYGMRNRLSRLGERFDDIEDDLERDWDRFEASAEMKWHQFRDAVRDGWHSIERRLPGDFDNDGR